MDVTSHMPHLKSGARQGPAQKPTPRSPSARATSPAGHAPREGPEGAEDPRNQVVALLPALRAFARALTRGRSEADDLVQETLLKALSNIDKFEPGTNMRAWLFTILRNSFYTDIRKRRRESDGLAHLAGQSHHAGPEQEWALTLKSMEEALTHLPDDQREALVLVGAAGLSYEEAANVCGCAVGTIKSRVNRARAKLLTLMGAEETADMVAPDILSLSAVSG
ncbi:sigma-70 family RNA polymerase sigma factor [Xanthobacter sp. TB0139]|uniref:sigma-70 family RNA polymerase sigma factor n=1 Tax=Xanthobacter sp. TB0139 TaxID=3459178 RepID=UPI00403A1AE6